MTQLPFRQRPTAPDCAVIAHASVEAHRSAIDPLRDAAVPAGAPQLPARFLRHCDEHTVVAVRAVLAALASVPEPPALDRCGVVAAPCQAGRIMAARSLSQLRTGGAVTVSPHIVPQCSLHSLAGAVSVALGMHGPHLGIGGGPDALAEGLFAAMTLFRGGAAAGCDAIWLVASEWDAEPELDAAGSPLGDPLCRGVALLLAPRSAGHADRLSLTLVPRAEAGEPVSAQSLAGFARAVEMCAEGAALTSWGVTCPWGAEIRLTAGAVMSDHRPELQRRREAA